MSTPPHTLILSAPSLLSHRSPVRAEVVLDLVDAAADAGFAGLSIWTEHHDWLVADGMPSETFFDHHRNRGMSMPAAEVVLGWVSTDRRAVAEATTHVLDIAVRAGAATVVAAALEPDIPDRRTAVAGLSSLCDLAAERGLGVSLEFLPWTAIPDLASAVRLVADVDRDHLGLVLDAWHWQRQPGGPDLELLRSVPADRIHLLQLNDAAAQPAESLRMEALGGRLLPGEGMIDLQALVDTVTRMGASPLVSSEVFSRALAELGPAECARRQFAAATAVLEAAAQQ